MKMSCLFICFLKIPPSQPYRLFYAHLCGAHWKSKALQFIKKKKEKKKIPSKQRRKQRSNSFFFFRSRLNSRAFMWDIYCLVFSCKHNIWEGKDWKLCLNSTSTYQQSPGGLSLPPRGCQSEGGGFKKTIGTAVLKLWKENFIYFSDFSTRVCVYPHVQTQELNLKRFFPRKVVDSQGRLLPLYNGTLIET